MDPLSLINTVTGVAGKVLDRVWPNPADKQKLEEAKSQITLAFQQQALAEKSDFRHYMLAYEGSAKDSPWIIQILRSSVRPVLTYLLVATTAWLVWEGRPIPAQLHQLDLMCCGFWFGERSVVKYLKAKRGGNEQK